jgi:isopentenyl-diphosphate delta-isomerase
LVTNTRLRKLDHIRITIDSDVEHQRGPGFELVELVHRAVPESSLEDVDVSVEFLGKKLAAPILVSGMTGGHEVAAKINCAIASAVEKLGLAMGVGSQRAAIEDEKLAWTFKVARKCAPTAPLIANIGAPQLVKGYTVKEVRKAIEMIDADAVAVHLNASQETFQPEGDVDYRGVLDKLGELVEALDVPVIVKETGHGIGYEVALALRQRGVRFFDVSGAGGTSWVLVEMYRARERGLDVLESAARTFASWGITTVKALVETRWAAPDSCIISSGGVRSGLDAAKSVAIGADLAAAALPVIQAYAEGGSAAVERLLDKMILEVKAAVFLTGGRSLSDLRRVRLFVSDELSSAFGQLGVDLDLYLAVLRRLYKPGENCRS